MPNSKKMTKQEMVKFKIILLQHKEEMLKEIGVLRESALNGASKDGTRDLSGSPLHQADVASDQYESDFMLRLAGDERQRLYAIDDALRRIQDKNYGKCEDCGCLIPRKRLKAFPQALKCIKCKQKHETNS